MPGRSIDIFPIGIYIYKYLIGIYNICLLRTAEFKEQKMRKILQFLVLLGRTGLFRDSRRMSANNNIAHMSRKSERKLRIQGGYTPFVPKIF
jgi:hypothetical protein